MGKALVQTGLVAVMTRFGKSKKDHGNQQAGTYGRGTSEEAPNCQNLDLELWPLELWKSYVSVG